MRKRRDIIRDIRAYMRLNAEFEREFILRETVDRFPEGHEVTRIIAD